MAFRAKIARRQMHNCFVSLPAAWVDALLDTDAASQPSDIALKIICSERKAVYVGWSGLASAAAEDIEIDGLYAEHLALADGAMVDAEFCSSIEGGRNATVEPLTEDDWEICELNGNIIESQFLNQVRIVFPGQKLSIRVSEGSSISFLVSSVEPDKDFVRLQLDAEVFIVPRKRKLFEKPKVPCILRRSCTHSEAANDQFAVYLHPEDAALNLNEMEYISISVCQRPQKANRFPKKDISLFVKVLKDANTPKGHIMLHPCMLKSLEEENHAIIRISRDQVVQITDGMHIKIKAFETSNFLDTDLEALLRETRGVLNKRQYVQVGDQSVRLECKEAFRLHSRMKIMIEHRRLPKNFDDIFEKQFYGYTTLINSAVDIIECSTDFQVPLQHVICFASRFAGKTTFLNKVAQALTGKFYIASIPAAVSAKDARFEDIRKQMQQVFAEAEWRKPSLILLDNLDILLPVVDEKADASQQTSLVLIGNLLSNLLAATSPSVIVLASARSQQSLRPDLTNFFLHVLLLPPPDVDIRLEILEGYLDSRCHSDLDLLSIARQCHGYLPLDLKNLVTRALVGSECCVAGAKHFASARLAYVPISLQNAQLQKEDTNVQWSDIGGLAHIQQKLVQAFMWPTRYAFLFAKASLRLQTGILLYGPPGCGKTMLGNAVAKECCVNQIVVKGPELLNKYIGASEQAVRDVFARAKSAKPCILFFDEIDSLAPQR